MSYKSPVGYLTPNEEEKFREWAFGSKHLFIDDFKQALKKWNRLHGKDLILKPNGNMSDDVPKMIELWRDNENKTT